MKKIYSKLQEDIYDTLLFLVTVYSFEHIKIVARTAAEQGASLEEFAESLPERAGDGLLILNEWQKDVMIENFALLQHEFLSKDLGSMLGHIKSISGMVHEMIMPEDFNNETIH